MATGRDDKAGGGGKAVWRPSEVTSRRGVDVDLAPDAEARAALAGDLGIRAVHALRLTGRLSPEGSRDFRLDARIAAEVEQDCVVTLDPVRTRIGETVVRRWLADMPAPTADEAEMPEDDSAEPLGPVIDLNAVMAEALALALPPWPRSPAAMAADGPAPDEAGKGDDGTRRPFAGLAALLGKGGGAE